MFGRAGPAMPLSSSNLRRLVILRGIEIGGLSLMLILAQRVLALPLPRVPWLAVIGCLTLANVLTLWRLRRPWPVADAELFGQLVLDVVAVTVVLYFSGGSTNPLVSFYLVPLVIAAISLPAAFTWTMVGLSVGCYTLLMFNYYPLMPQNGDFSTAVYLHLTGMWLTFVLSAFLIAFFVVRMTRAIKERDRELAAAREETLRNERIVALGTLAAGAAHELGTPLATMAVVTHELEREHGAEPELAEDLALLRQQVDQCKRILSRLLASAGQTREEDVAGLALDRYLDELMDTWQLMRPGVDARTQWRGPLPAPRIVVDQTLSQALMNLLNNAADASPRDLEITADWDERLVRLEIRDRGPGLSQEAAQRAGQPFFTTKGPGHGFGIGLFLANATIERFGGKATLVNREGGGALTEVSLPLAKLTQPD